MCHMTLVAITLALVNRIRAVRQALQERYPDAFTLEEVARRLGVSALTLRSWEYDRHRPRKRQAERLARALGTTIEDLGLAEPAATATQPAATAAPGDDMPEPGKPTVALAIIVRNGHVLMTERRFKEGPFAWGFPSGQVELPGETAEEAAVREVREELAASVRVLRRLGERVGPTGRHMVYLACELADGSEPELVDHEELAGIHWLTLAELDERAAPQGGVFAPVREYLARVLISAEAGSRRRGGGTEDAAGLNPAG